MNTSRRTPVWTKQGSAIHLFLATSLHLWTSSDIQLKAMSRNLIWQKTRCRSGKRSRKARESSRTQFIRRPLTCSSINKTERQMNQRIYRDIQVGNNQFSKETFSKCNVVTRRRRKNCWLSWLEHKSRHKRELEATKTRSERDCFKWVSQPTLSLDNSSSLTHTPNLDRANEWTQQRLWQEAEASMLKRSSSRMKRKSCWTKK